ncbi:MAG: DUF2680 domain-containing protein [Lachnospiraceae bacterium]|nr:DUF2680 domain-containing protein [Lachnospiraceae bacterium]
MKSVKRFIKATVIMGVLFALGTAGTVFAASLKTPAEIVSVLTGKTADEVNSERADGKTYGAIAKDAGKLEEFKTQMLEQRKDYLEQRVKDGTLSQEEADTIYQTMEERQLTCDGTGSVSQGAGCGAAIGAGGCGMGNNQNRGAGRGMGCGFQK